MSEFDFDVITDNIPPRRRPPAPVVASKEGEGRRPSTPLGAAPPDPHPVKQESR